MIERVLEQERAISQVLASDKKTRHLVLTWHDLEVLESVNKALKPLVEFTDALSGEDYVTVSYVKPVLNLFHSTILAVQEDDTPLAQSIKTSILDYLRKKFDDPTMDTLLDMASLVDPRFKISYISAEKVDEITCRAILEMEAARSDQGTLGSAASQPDKASTVPELEPPKKKTL